MHGGVGPTDLITGNPLMLNDRIEIMLNSTGYTWCEIPSIDGPSLAFHQGELECSLALWSAAV